MPNLYPGSPVRVYGRYRGAGRADIQLRASINGRELKESAKLEFPKVDLANPEIDRLWAQRRINGLLKQADRQGDRSSVIAEIVRLGEDFSITTEYTSFIVLENDAEYQRWKITRKNVDTFGRDQVAQGKRREQLELIRNKAMADLGPQPPKPAAPSAPQQLAFNTRSTPQSDPAPTTPTPNQPAPRQSWNMGTGSGPVGPLGVLAALWLLRRKQRVA